MDNGIQNGMRSKYISWACMVFRIFLAISAEGLEATAKAPYHLLELEYWWKDGNVGKNSAIIEQQFLNGIEDL